MNNIERIIENEFSIQENTLDNEDVFEPDYDDDGWIYEDALTKEEGEENEF